jgi:hypothetical protein
MRATDQIRQQVVWCPTLNLCAVILGFGAAFNSTREKKHLLMSASKPNQMRIARLCDPIFGRQNNNNNNDDTRIHTWLYTERVCVG